MIQKIKNVFRIVPYAKSDIMKISWKSGHAVSRDVANRNKDVNI